ncbi:MAG: hypothetical protein V1820_02225 [archaeon]
MKSSPFRDYLLAATRNRATLAGYVSAGIFAAGLAASIFLDPEAPEIVHELVPQATVYSLLSSVVLRGVTSAGTDTLEALQKARKRLARNGRRISQRIKEDYYAEMPYCTRVGYDLALEEAGLADEFAQYRKPLRAS